MKTLFNLLLFLSTFLANSQNIKVTGIVNDSLGNGLEMANVMAINLDDDKMDGYNITGNNGQFSLNLKPNTNYQLRITYIGYSQKNITFKTDNNPKQFTVTLEHDSTLLDEIEIVHQMPVSIKGDTIVYNADSFTSGTERKLGDILKKLPGVEVDADGNVTVEGKRVEKLMVENRDFFDGNTKLGVQNIPADAVDKIEVLKNYNDVNQLKSVTNNQDNLAMNIKLKENKKYFWFGDANAGIGVAHEDARYIVNPKLFFYSPKYTLNFITNFNNIGEQALTFMDYFKMTGGLKNMISKGGSTIKINDSGLDFSLIPNNRVKDMHTKFGAFNFSYNPTETWTLSGFGIVTNHNTLMDFWNRNSILNAETGEVLTVQESNSSTDLGSKYIMSKLSSRYKPNDNLTFDYDVLAKKSRANEFYNTSTTVLPNTTQSQVIHSSKKQNQFSINQNLGLYYQANENHIFSFEMQHLYKDEDPFSNNNLQFKPFNLAGYIDNQKRQNINQSKYIQTNKIDTKLDYFYAVSRKTNLNITLGKSHSYQKFNSNIFQILDINDQNDLVSDELNNDVTYQFNDNFVGLHYKIMLGKLTFTPGVSFHQYTLNDIQLGSENKNKFSKILPDFDAYYEFSRSKRLNYRFGLTNSFTDITNLAEGYILQGSDNLFKGNRNLESVTNISHSLSYTNFSTYYQQHLSVHLSYTKMLDNINTVARFDGINRTTNLFNSNFADEQFNGHIGYGKTFADFYKLNAKISTGLLRKNVVQINHANNESFESTRESINQLYDFSFRTTYKEVPNLEVGYTFAVNKYPGDSFYTKSPKVALDYYFLNGFALTADYTYNNYHNKSKSVTDKYEFLNASIGYHKKDTHWEYRLSATNILNTKTLNSDHFSQFNITTSKFNIQPRYIILSLKYIL